MRVSLSTRRPPSLLEQLVGRRRTRLLRRRLGFVALGVSYSMLKPRSKVVPTAVVTTAVLVAALLTLH